MIVCIRFRLEYLKKGWLSFYNGCGFFILGQDHSIVGYVLTIFEWLLLSIETDYVIDFDVYDSNFKFCSDVIE